MIVAHNSNNFALRSFIISQICREFRSLVPYESFRLENSQNNRVQQRVFSHTHIIQIKTWDSATFFFLLRPVYVFIHVYMYEGKKKGKKFYYRMNRVCHALIINSLCRGQQFQPEFSHPRHCTRWRRIDSQNFPSPVIRFLPRDRVVLMTILSTTSRDYLPGNK